MIFVRIQGAGKSIFFKERFFDSRVRINLDMLMFGARIYNERLGNSIDEIYGCVTTGDVWRFLKLKNKLAEVESKSLEITADLEQIIGILGAMTFGETEG